MCLLFVSTYCKEYIYIYICVLLSTYIENNVGQGYNLYTYIAMDPCPLSEKVQDTPKSYPQTLPKKVLDPWGIYIHYYIICICIYIYIIVDTSRTAQGGGGSFKNRTPIGDVGCCESRMAERSHCWTDRRLISLSLFL